MRPRLDWGRLEGRRLADTRTVIARRKSDEAIQRNFSLYGPGTIKTRRFPPPWSIENLDAAFVVKDRARHKLAYVYYEEGPGRRTSAKLLTKEEARRNAVSVAKLPGFLRKE